MPFLDHVRASNAHDLSGFRPLRVGGTGVGWIRHALADRMAGWPCVAVGDDAVDLVVARDDFDGRSAALHDFALRIVAAGWSLPLRGEPFPVVTRWGAPPLAKVDRAVLPALGLRSHGIHVNGFVVRPDGVHMWIAKRARDRSVAPGKLDHVVAGGQPYGLSLDDNLVKEAGEEAGFAPAVARRAIPVGTVSYCLEGPDGLRRDTLFVYDLALTETEVPRNTDGEVEAFALWPLDRVAAAVRDGDDFKFNVNLVIMDFLVRHGWFRPDDPGYLDVVTGLRRDV
jgi:hypothetical protein